MCILRLLLCPIYLCVFFSKTRQRGLDPCLFCPIRPWQCWCGISLLFLHSFVRLYVCAIFPSPSPPTFFHPVSPLPPPSPPPHSLPPARFKRINESCATRECVVSHMWTSDNYACFLSQWWMRGGTHTNESCTSVHESYHAYELVLSQLRMRRGTHMDESCATYEWFMLHLRMSHVPHKNDIFPAYQSHVTHNMHNCVCHTCKWLLVTRVNESFTISEWVSRVWMQCVSHNINESCSTYERVIPHLKNISQAHSSSSSCVWTFACVYVCMCSILLYVFETPPQTVYSCLLPCHVMQCDAVWCSVLHCVGVWCTVLQCGAEWCSVL